MKLIENIACYSGEVRRRINQVIDDDVRESIANAVLIPERLETIGKELMAELIEMGIFRVYNGRIVPDTAIFFEQDIIMMTDFIFKISEDIAEIVKISGKELMDCSPNIKNFIGSIMGMNQGLHDILKKSGLASNWQKKTGKYERSKVDFNEKCGVYDRFGDDLQTKSVSRGGKYTGVIIGPGLKNYCTYMWSISNPSQDNKIYSYSENLVTYLTDIFPLLINGEIVDEALMKAAKAANINVKDKSSVITSEDAAGYQSIIDRISSECSKYYLSKMEDIRNLLANTIAGRQGASIKNMMMNLWRYLRKGAAIKLYENGFLNDRIPIDGCITIFYENGIDYFN